jgi:hypothetical protein
LSFGDVLSKTDRMIMGANAPVDHNRQIGDLRRDTSVNVTSVNVAARLDLRAGLSAAIGLLLTFASLLPARAQQS